MITYRVASLSELQQILDWAAQEGWNPGLDDAEAFFRADPHGFFIAVDDDNTPVAAISVVNHSDDFAFLGLYIVRPEFRGQGIGFGLWTHAMNHAGNRTVGLDGVEAQQNNYKKSGFTLYGSTTRYTGQIQRQSHPDIRIAGAKDIPRLIEIEANASGVKKPDYLAAWFENVSGRTTILRHDPNGISGFCTIRACQNGAKIGPLYVGEAEGARDLIAQAASLFDGPYTLDVPETSTELTQMCRQLGWTAGFKTARMYRGAFASPQCASFAVTSLELG